MDMLTKGHGYKLQKHLLWREILDTLPEHLCVISTDGVIEFINQAWLTFATNNGAHESLIGVGINYLDVCDASANRGDSLSAEVAAAIRAVAADRSQSLYIEYPCHSPTEKRWFMMRIARLGKDTSNYLLIDHHNITERKLAELQVESLARLDPLTSLVNRRFFRELSDKEWRRSIRNQSVVSIAMIDCDRFKKINDEYGHQTGDVLLIAIAESLDRITRRPGDIAVRYGGDEFLIYQNETSAAESFRLLTSVVEEIKAKAHRIGINGVSLSIGIAEQYPDEESDLSSLIREADLALYQAKHQGKNQICLSESLL